MRGGGGGAGLSADSCATTSATWKRPASGLLPVGSELTFTVVVDRPPDTNPQLQIQLPSGSRLALCFTICAVAHAAPSACLGELTLSFRTNSNALLTGIVPEAASRCSALDSQRHPRVSHSALPIRLFFLGSDSHC